MQVELSNYLALEDVRRPRRTLSLHALSAADMEAGLERHQFIPMFQPRVRPLDGSVHSVQATVFWAHPRYGMLAPSAFLCEADQFGLLEQVAEQLMRNALAAWRDWPAGAGLPLLSLHLSGAVLRTAGMARLLSGLIGASGLDRRSVEFEADSLPSVLTLEAPLLSDATEDAAARLGLGQRVAQAQASGQRIVAGGVDSLLEWRLAKELGCDVAQGDFIAAPMPLTGLPTALSFWRSSYRALAAPDFFDF